MKKKSKYGMFVIALVSAVAFLGGCWTTTPEQRAKRMAGRVADELEMNKDQTAQLQRSASKLLEKGKELMDIRKTVAEELVLQLRNDKVDQPHLNQVLNENKEKLASMLALFAEQFASFHQSLTPEQRAQAADKIEEYKNKQSHHRWWGSSRYAKLSQ